MEHGQTSNPTRRFGIELDLVGRAPIRRNLALHLSHGRLSVSASLTPTKSSGYHHLCWVAEDLKDCRLTETGNNFTLWIGHTSFTVTAAEALRIRTTYSPLGLCVEKRDVATHNVLTTTAEARP